MFNTVNNAINKLEKKGYLVIAPEDIKKCDCDKINRTNKKITKKYNNLIKDMVAKLTIKEMREQLSANGVTELPKTKAELIDLYVKTFSE